jgi:tetratricopeptide (TPR) repeat protein
MTKPHRPSFDIFVHKGAAFLAQRDAEAALRCFDQALEFYPREALAWANRGAALDAIGRYREA